MTVRAELVRTVLDGEVDVSYSQIYVLSEEAPDFGGMDDTFGGQSNGLCGAAWPGALWLFTGLKYGLVGFRVEVHDERPEPDDAWEEIVEASFRPQGRASLEEWGGGDSWDLGLADADYRVRYSACGMDRASDEDTRDDGEPVIDRYLLQFWPCPPEPDQVVKCTAESAAYWHSEVGELPPPTLPDPVEAARWKAEAEAWEAERIPTVTVPEADHWGGTLPSPALRELVGGAREMAMAERELAEALAAESPQRRRKIAAWVARRAYEEIGLAELDWVAPALTAVEQGEPLPSPFHVVGLAWHRLRSEPGVPDSVRAMARAGIDEDSPMSKAVSTLFAAAQPDPLWAALATLYTGIEAFGAERRFMVDEVKAQLGLDFSSDRGPRTTAEDAPGS
ncbi:hypothetical protein [Streptomyces sp. NPDC047108]|uniref:hypothetical protein n=1 Tax=Streptomyces sp. NPDC047108 TaxID=3155025 RepID=UPI0033D594B5